MESLKQQAVPEEWPDSLKSLWFLSKGNWDASHDITQELHTKTGSWIHALLHRMEGDAFNAGYWYRQADRPFSEKTFEDEIKEITEFILETENQ